MRKIVLMVFVLGLLLSAISVSAQDATATPVPEPTMTPTPLPPVEFAQTQAEFMGDSDNFAGVDPSGQTVTYWHQYNSPTQLATITGLVNAFNANNPYGITVNAVSKGNYNDIATAMNAAIVSGDLPNLVAGYNNNALSYDLEGVVVDLAPYFTDAKWGYSGDATAELNMGILDAFSFDDGRRLGWVNQVSANAMVINNKMLTDLGFTGAPATLDDFKKIACAAAQSGTTGAEGAAVNGYPIVADSSQFESFVASIGGSIFTDGKWDFSNDKVTQVLQMYQDLYNQGCAYIPQENFGNTGDFSKGLNPMAVTSTGGFNPIISQIKAAGDLVTDWSATVPPPAAAGEKPALQLFTPGIIEIASSPEQQLASWIFLRYLTQADVSQQWSEAMAFFPVNLTASKNMTPANPYFGAINDLIANQSVNIYISPKLLSYGAVRALVATAIADITSGGQDIATVTQKLTDDANAAMENG